jgi:nitrate reductase (NAD(P)H)
VDVWEPSRSQDRPRSELNVNSAIARPEHNESLRIPTLEADVSSASTYTIRGYAYSGGGRRVTRAEVTLDDGRTWRLANMSV